ncbi:SDR family NAD(P)-dependent oxidoreductase [uncultured Ilumatobacter sp.]|uniref:SDR family NAD(P)-dependent oxidoreductase n=1 Tax=uncultured Ilumatobacter sp. TaxID=879968 RepID=UPI00374EBC50
MNVPNTATYATYPSLVDRTVFVTGGAEGIGAAIVEEFVRQGSKVGFADINADKGVETIERCTASNPRHTPHFYEVDLVDISATQAVVRQAQSDLGGLTVLVNNAANDERHTWEGLSADDWDDRMNTNLRHYFFTIQAAAPEMIERQNGSIINIGSSSYMMQEDFFPGYAIAKSGVEGITRTLARTFGPDNVRVNTVLPGWVATEKQLTKWWSEEGETETLRDQALKRRIYPAEFAQMVLFLASDDGAACSAQQFLVDGGRR